MADQKNYVNEKFKLNDEIKSCMPTYNEGVKFKVIDTDGGHRGAIIVENVETCEQLHVQESWFILASEVAPYEVEETETETQQAATGQNTAELSEIETLKKQIAVMEENHNAEIEQLKADQSAEIETLQTGYELEKMQAKEIFDGQLKAATEKNSKKK